MLQPRVRFPFGGTPLNAAPSLKNASNPGINDRLVGTSPDSAEALIPLSLTSGACSLIWLEFHAHGFLPTILVDGQVAVEALEWIKAKSSDERAAPSTLYRRGHSIRLLIEFYCFYRTSGLDKPFMNAFFDNRVHGNDSLGWPSVFVKTAKQNLKEIEQFFDWYAEERDVVNPNPIVNHPMPWGRILTEAARRHRSDLLAHLFFKTKASRVEGKRKFRPSGRADRGRTSSKPPSKSFTFESFVLLVRHERNPRLRMLWLLLGAGGVRRSEILQLLEPDVTYNRVTGECEILLADPTYGPIHDPASNSLITRKEYLRRYFNLRPREEELPTGTRFLGWKGMRFQEGSTAGITWLHPYYGRLAWKTHLEYLDQRSYLCGGRHPWYLVNSHAPVGEPIAWSNLNCLLKTACRRLGIPPPHNVHSLRHMYVNFVVHVLGLSLAQAQILVRHVSPESTALYAATSKEMIRRSLELVASKHPSFLNFPEFGVL